MLEQLESYRPRFWKRFLRDATPWARDNIIWGLAVLICPPLAIYFRDRHAQIDWTLIRTTLALYVFAFVVYALIHICQTPKKLDTDRQYRESSLLKEITDLGGTIKTRDDTIRTLSDKPKRSPAEQHEYEHARNALSKSGPKAIAVLKFLVRHGEQVFGMYNPAQLPDGINGEEMRRILDELAKDGLMSRRDIQEVRNPHSIYDIPVSMKSILEELLYQQG
jgi:hypothetical protein